MNAATAIITTRSPYFVRTSVAVAAGDRQRSAAGLPRTASSRSTPWSRTTAPASIRRQRSRTAFKQGGGNIVGSVRFPVASPDFSAFAQRLKDSNAEVVFIFVPGGEQPAALGKALAERGISPKNTKVMSQRRTHQRRRRSRAGRGRGRHHQRLELRPAPQIGDERGVRQGHARDAGRPQSGPVRGQRL